MSLGNFQHHSYATEEPDEGHAWLCRMYTDFELSVQSPGSEFRFTAATLAVGPSVLSTVRHSMTAEARSRDGLEQQVFIWGRVPTTAIEAGHQQTRLGSGEAFSIRPFVPYRTTWRTLEARAVSLDPALLADVAAQLTGSTEPVVFEFGPAVSPVAAAHWNRVCLLVQRVALANRGNPDGALLADDLGRLLCTTALTCFPNTTQADPEPPPIRTSPRSLRRAIAFIDDHLDRPISLTAMAEAAAVSPRALNQTFNRHLGLSPMAYVRRARLDRAHRDLQDAQPCDGGSVTEIAARWGFRSLPRFDVLYREAYGRPPSHTVRRS